MSTYRRRLALGVCAMNLATALFVIASLAKFHYKWATADIVPAIRHETNEKLLRVVHYHMYPAAIAAMLTSAAVLYVLQTQKKS